jgi:hypothetical protein
VHPGDARLAASHVVEGGAQRGELVASRDQSSRGQRVAVVHGHREAQRLGAAQPAQDFVSVGAPPGVARHQSLAQIREVARRPGGELAQCVRFDGLFGREHLVVAAAVGPEPREQLVQCDPHCVPVTRRRRRRPGELLGRDVHWRADDAVRWQVVAAGARDLHGDSEVDEYDALTARYNNVRRFDVAVQMPRPMQRRNAARQLHERPPQAIDLLGARHRGRERLRSAGHAAEHGRDVGARRARTPATAQQLGHRDTGGSGLDGVAAGARERWLERVGRERGGRAADVRVVVEPVEQLHGEKPAIARSGELVQRNQMRMAHVGE